MGYVWKRDEFVWALLVAIAPPVLLALSQFDPTAITDYRVWAGSVVAAVVRAAGGFGLAWIMRSKDASPT